MRLLYPYGLAALVSIPLLYLLAVALRRPYRLVVSSLLIWKKLPPPDAAKPLKARHRITSSFILLAVGLALASLAVARPGLVADEPPAPKIMIALDTSASMMTMKTGSTRTRWELAVEDLWRFFDALPRDAHIFLVTDVPGAGLVHFKAGERSAVGELFWKGSWTPEGVEVDAAPLKAGPYHVNLEGLVNQAVATAEAVGARDLFVFSDHQPAVTVENKKLRTRYALYGEPSRNIGIVRASMRPTSPEAADCLVAVGNFSAERRLVKLTVVRPEGVPAISLELAPDSSTEHVFEGLPLDNRKNTSVLIEVSPADSIDDDLSCDNTATLQLLRDSKLRICLVSRDNSRLERALLATGAVHLESHGELPDIPDNAFDLYVFDRAKPARMPRSSVVLIKPPAECPPFRVGVEVEPHSDIVLAQHELMRDVRLESVRFRRVKKLELMPEAPGKFLVLASQGETTLVASYEDDLTGQWLLMIPFDVSWRFEESETDWATLPAFPIFWMNVVEHALARRDKHVSSEHGADSSRLSASGDRVCAYFASVLGVEESRNAGTGTPFDPTVSARLEPPPLSEEVGYDLCHWLIILGIFCVLIGWRMEGAR